MPALPEEAVLASREAVLASRVCKRTKVLPMNKRKGWLTTVGLVSHNTSALRARLQRADSKRTLIANNAAFARKVLEEFAAIPRTSIV